MITRSQPHAYRSDRGWRAYRIAYLLAAGAITLYGICLTLFPLIPRAVEAAAMPVRNLTGGARIVHVNGFALWYREVGKRRNPAIVVLHGGPGMSDHYFANGFDYLSNRYRVIYYDQRGSGFSEIKANPKYYRFEYLVDDLEALRRTVIHQKRLILIAHSFGGLIAMKYAIEHPERVSKLILISSMPARDWGSRIDADATRYDDYFMRMDPVTRDRVFTQSYENSVGDTLYDPVNGPIPQVGYMSYVPSRLLWDTSVGYDFTKGLAKLALPSLIIYGAADTFLESVPLSLHATLRESQLVRFDRSGHWSFLEEPARFKAVVKAFLEAGAGAGAPISPAQAPNR